MSLILEDRLLDFGAAGVLAVTTESDYAPVLAVDGCFAEWMDADGAWHDRRELFAIELEGAALRTAVAERAKAASGAVASVRGHWDWLMQRATATPSRVFPCEVHAMHDGRVLAVYAAPGHEPRIRYLDVLQNRELWALDEAEFRRAWKVPAPPVWQRMLGSAMSARPRVLAQGRWEACLAIDAGSFLLRPDVDARRAESRLGERGLADLCYAGSWRVERSGDRESGTFSVARANEQETSRALSASRPGWVSGCSGALDADILAFCHAGGEVEVHSLPADQIGTLRPFPALTRDAQVGVELDRLGQSLLARHGVDVAVVDLTANRRAAIYFGEEIDFDRHAFDAAVRHRPSLLVRDRELWMMQGNRRGRVPFDHLEWQALAGRPADAGAAASTRSKPVENLADSLKLPRIDAVLAKPQPSSSTLVLGHYGPLPSNPQHERVDMAMLCQIDCTAVAAEFGDASPLPAAGCLRVFVSVDESGELVEGDELGSPADLRVEHVNGPALSVPTPARKRHVVGPRALVLQEAHTVLPDVDSVHVAAFLQDADSIEAYRALLPPRDEREDNPAIRLGGYPLPLQGNDIEVEAAQRAELCFDRDTSPHEWRLLLQFESDEFMWGTDSGCLYVMIHAQDLAAHDFSQVVWIVQGL
jgi:hypothetical protein